MVRRSEPRHGADYVREGGLEYWQYWHGVRHTWYWHGLAVWTAMRKRPRPWHLLIKQAVGA